MLGKIRKMLKIFPKVFIVMGSVSVALAMLLSMVSEPAHANTIQTQETCPKDAGWTKVDGLTGKSYSFNSSSDKLIVEWCYKASTTVKYGSVYPPSSSYTVESSVKDKNQEIQNLSDASFRLIDGSPTNTPIMKETQISTPTSTPEFDGPIPTNTPTNMPEQTLTNTPTSTPVFDGPIPTYTPTNTPEPTLTNTPTNTPVFDNPTPIPDDLGQTPTPNDTGLTSTPDVDVTTDPIIAPTFSPPRNNDLLTLLIPVTGSELNGISPLEKVRSLLFNFGLIIFGFGLVFQSIRKKLNL